MKIQRRKRDTLKNILLELEYVGTNYFGFQIQNNNKKGETVATIQKELEDALEKLFRRKIKIIYASRTDRGVHAKMQVVNFYVNTTIPLLNIKKALNSFLPPDIKIKKIKSVGHGFHSRYSVRTKIYRYVILNKKEADVFSYNLSWHISEKLDLVRMVKSTKFLVGEKDFSLFVKGASCYKNRVRKITNISIKKRGCFVFIDIEGVGFMRYMVRNMVKFIVDVGLKKVLIKDIKDIVNGKMKYNLRIPAPASGLYLYRIKY